MLFNQNSKVLPSSTATAFLLIFISLSGCAKASDPELYRADPNLLDDQTLSLPATGRSGGFSYAIIQGVAIFEGDILLGKVDKNGALPQKILPRGLGRNDAFGRWTNGIVPYFIPENNSNILKQKIAEAIAHWTQETNLTFVLRTEENKDSHPNYIRFESTNSCASYVGMQGGEQSVLVSDECPVGSIVHEIGHALGLFHEHTRPDRDNYAQINWDEVESGREINFEVLEAGVQSFGPYDYGSIMHYGEYFFSDSDKPTIVVPDGISIGQRQSLSPSDIDAANNMYATDLVLFQPTLNDTSEGLEVGISIANQGSLGAQQLQIVASISDDANWSGISPDSGWECASVGSELRCNRHTLKEQTASNFTLLVSTTSKSHHDVRLTISSRTTDTDLSNNSYNDELVDVPATESQNQQELNAAAQTDQSITSAPSIGAAETALPIKTVAPPMAAAEAASDNGYLAALAGFFLLCQRRRRRVFIERA